MTDLIEGYIILYRCLYFEGVIVLNRKNLKSTIPFALVLFVFVALSLACATGSGLMQNVSRERELTLGSKSFTETDFGGVERWYVVDKYSDDYTIRFQVGYFKERNIGFILYEDGTVGEQTHFSRDGVDLRWDWGNYRRKGYRYTFVIEPDGTGLYYDFSTSTDGTAKPRGLYRAYKF